MLVRNVVLNLAGWVLPALTALLAIPRLLHEMGQARFAVLTLAWSLVGYLSFFDLGIARALIQVLAERVGADDQTESPALTWTGLWLLLPLGLVCAGALAGFSQPLAYRVLQVPPPLREETAVALRLIALAVPFMVLTSGLRAVLEAGQRFRLINALRVPLGVLTFAGPWAAQRVDPGLASAVGILVVARVVIFVLHAVVVLRAVPELRRPRLPCVQALARLRSVAGWMSVSSIVSPLMVSADRFVIGAMLPVAAVAYYSTTNEVATKLWLFTAALQPVLLPALSATVLPAPARAAALFDRSVRVIFLTLLLPTLALVLFAYDGLALWLGASFARESAPILQGLAVAVFVNAIGQMAHTVVQSGNRSDITGKLHLLELPLYIGLLVLLFDHVGIFGVAVAWLARMLFDTTSLLLVSARVLPPARQAVRRAFRLLGVALVLGAVACVPLPLAWRVAEGLVVSVVLALVGWTRLVTPTERELLRTYARRLLPARVLETEPGRARG